MAKQNEQFTEMNRKSMDAALKLAQMSFDNAQRMMALQSDLAKEIFQSGMANAKAQASASDPQAGAGSSSRRRRHGLEGRRGLVDQRRGHLARVELEPHGKKADQHGKDDQRQQVAFHGLAVRPLKAGEGSDAWGRAVWPPAPARRGTR